LTKNALEEEMQELFNSYEEHGLEQELQELENKLEEAYTQEQGLEISNELKQENHQEQQELENIMEGNHIQAQEEKSNLEIERIQEQDEKEVIKESHHTEIKEKNQELSPDVEQSNKKNQEIEQSVIQEVHQNVVQEEIRKKGEKQKEQTLKESDELYNERYKQETRGRPFYKGKETKGFIKWKKNLKEQKEKQEVKNELLLEKVEEKKEKSKEIREYKEEWAQYLANSIKESEFPEEIKEKLSDFLEKQENLRELLERSKTKEISEEMLEKELAKFEDILIEKRNIAKPLFMNFDWFRRYYNEMIRKSGRRVANLYISKKTREFLSHVSERIEQLENLRSLDETAEKFEEYLDKSFQIREKWALLLTRLIHEVPNKEITKETKRELKTVIKWYCEIKTILCNKNILREDKEKLIQRRIEKYIPRFFELFEILRRFLGIYGYYSRNWMEQSLIIAGKSTVSRLSQKLENIKKRNLASNLVKTIIEQISLNKHALAVYHKEAKTSGFTLMGKGSLLTFFTSKGGNKISPRNLGMFLGKIAPDTVNKWRNSLNKENFSLSTIDFRKINSWVMTLFKGEGSGVIQGRGLIQASLNTYMNENFAEMDFITKILFLLDKNAFWDNTGLPARTQAHSETFIEKQLSGKGYLQSIRYSSREVRQQEEYSKYLRLTTNLLLLKKSSFKWKSDAHYNKFKEEALDIVFQEMIDKGIYNDEDDIVISGLKEQHEALFYTLYALTEVRFEKYKNNPSGLEPFKDPSKNPKGLYTLTQLSTELGTRHLLGDYIRYNTYMTPETVAKLKNILKSEIFGSSKSKKRAIQALNKIPKFRSGNKSSYLGRVSHPILEDYLIKVLKKRGIFSKYEDRFNKPTSNHRIDSLIDLDSEVIKIIKEMFGTSLTDFSAIFIDYVIPSLRKFDKSVMGKVGKYAGDNRLLTIIFYGSYSSKAFELAQQKLASYPTDHKQNVVFVDLIDFAKELKILTDLEILNLEKINNLIKAALIQDEDALKELERRLDLALIDLETYRNNFLGRT